MKIVKTMAGCNVNMNSLGWLIYNDNTAIDRLVGGSKLVFEKIIYYIPFIGIGIFIFGACIAIFSIVNKGNRRWGVRMAVVTSIALFFTYIGIIVVYDTYVIGKKPEIVVRPELSGLDHYGEVYFNVLEELLELEKKVGLADKMLSRNIPELLVNFYKESAFDIGIVVFGLGFLLAVIVKKNVPLKKWARIILCVVMPIILYAGHWYVSRL